MDSEKAQLSQMSQVPQETLDAFLKAMYGRLRTKGILNDQLYRDDAHYVKAGNINEMNENQKEIFFGIVKDCYNGLITMPEVEISHDKFLIKVYDSDTRTIAHVIKLTSLELINHILITIFVYIYKLQNVNIKFGFPPNDYQKYEFTKLYTLILNIPGMAERITNLSTNIDSNGETTQVETYYPIENSSERVIPPRPESGWPSEKLGGRKSTSRKSTSRKSSSRKSSSRKRGFKYKSRKQKYGRKKYRKLSLPFRKR